jgi:hypothetical protein
MVSRIIVLLMAKQILKLVNLTNSKTIPVTIKKTGSKFSVDEHVHRRHTVSGGTKFI